MEFGFGIKRVMCFPFQACLFPYHIVNTKHPMILVSKQNKCQGLQKSLAFLFTIAPKANDRSIQKVSSSQFTPSIQTQHIGHFYKKDIIRPILK
jgi:hypothetical protein